MNHQICRAFLPNEPKFVACFCAKLRERLHRTLAACAVPFLCALFRILPFQNPTQSDLIQVNPTKSDQWKILKSGPKLILPLATTAGWCKLFAFVQRAFL
jgi:hypothetical protein